MMVISIECLLSLFFLFLSVPAKAIGGPYDLLDNAVIGEPQVDCMEDRVRLTFRTEKPFNGRVFVRGMVENDKCLSSYTKNSRPSIDFEVVNGECNMRRSRKINPEERGVEQSITIVVSFHDTFITKVDRAYRCTCFYMESDKIVTSSIDVSALPTTDLIDTARMPTCGYYVRRGSVNGPIVSYATVGEPVFHVWQCDSDMFSMLVHSCYVDDGNGGDRKQLIDEHGCAVDSFIVPDLTYNSNANLAYTEVSIFKFADKVTTYFQCAVSTCMISEGLCTGKTPPKCVPSNTGLRKARHTDHIITTNSISSPESASSSNASLAPTPAGFDYTMDLAADKIIVFDLDDINAADETVVTKVGGKNARASAAITASQFIAGDKLQHAQQQFLSGQQNPATAPDMRVCLGTAPVLFLLTFVTLTVTVTSFGVAYIFLRNRGKF